MEISFNILNFSDQDFELFRDIISRESGINLHEGKKALVQSRLMRRLRELSMPDYQDYYNYLIKNYSEEIINLINCITTNKTEFFRESDHFHFLTSTALPYFEKTQRKELRIWSAGCSRGDEPYSIAITLLEYFMGRSSPEIKILATDIDTSVLQTGILGVYDEEDLKVLNEELLKKYFYRGRGKDAGLFKVKDNVKKLISFRRLNLLEGRFPMKKTFDIIFCRNVVIYFTKESRMELLKHFYRFLSDDGYLFMGHSETLTSLSDLFRLKGHSIYEKARLKVT